MTNVTKMPAIFFGHGSPMNALENNTITQEWQKLGQTLPKPDAILAISAHWYIPMTAITAQNTNQTIHDFFGFPQELTNYDYCSQGSSEIAQCIADSLAEYKIQITQDKWGLDHGVWSILTHMYPKPEMPILQLSIDLTKPPQWHYELGQQLNKLRTQGIMIIGSGNIVHNLGMLSWHKPQYGADWTCEFDQLIVKNIQERNSDNLINYYNLSQYSTSSVPTPEHYLPLLYIVGASDSADKLTVFNQEYHYGSLSMTSILFS